MAVIAWHALAIHENQQLNRVSWLDEIEWDILKVEKEINVSTYQNRVKFCIDWHIFEKLII